MTGISAEQLPQVGDLIGPLRLDRIAHGGHCVGRLSALVFFVRHGIPGETVRVRVSEVSRRFVRADVVEVLEASPRRVVPPCPVAARCGGCDFQHIEAAHQRELKRQVLVEQLSHLAGYDWAGFVEEVEPSPLGWRTRMRYSVAPDGRAGLKAHRSHEVVPLPSQGCLTAVGSIRRPGRLAGDSLAVAPAVGQPLLLTLDDEPRVIEEVAAGRHWRVSSHGFWQVHPRAADTLVDAVGDGLSPAPGERALDLYCGVGLFAGVLVDAGCQVIGVEGDRTAVSFARRNVAEASFVVGAVERRLDALPDEADLVVLDPPRQGAGRPVMTGVIERSPRAIAYVACDPAALGRDLAFALDRYRVASLRAFDLFPMTHHVEAVAILERR